MNFPSININSSISFPNLELDFYFLRKTNKSISHKWRNSHPYLHTTYKLIPLNQKVHLFGTISELAGNLADDFLGSNFMFRDFGEGVDGGG